MFVCITWLQQGWPSCSEGARLVLSLIADYNILQSYDALHVSEFPKAFSLFSCVRGKKGRLWLGVPKLELQMILPSELLHFVSLLLEWDQVHLISIWHVDMEPLMNRLKPSCDGVQISLPCPGAISLVLGRGKARSHLSCSGLISIPSFFFFFYFPSKSSKPYYELGTFIISSPGRWSYLSNTTRQVPGQDVILG